MNPALIVRALTTFKADVSMTPGRFNLTEINGVQVLLDYGHNVAAIQALGEAVQTIGERKTIMTIGLPGDRRDEDILATVDATLPFVNEYVFHDLQDRRERAANEVPKLMQSRLPAGVPSHIIQDQYDAIMYAWRRMRPGQRLIVIADVVDETVPILNALAESVMEDAACVSPLTASYDEGR